MSDSEDDSTVRQTLRTVTPYYRGQTNREMNLLGLTWFLLLVVLLVPLLPFIVIIWVLTKVFGAIGQ